MKFAIKGVPATNDGDPPDFPLRGGYQRKPEESASHHLMDLGQRYHGSKGVRETRQEDGVLGNLASPGHREESASHHLSRRTSTQVILSSGVTILMRFGGSIARHQMKLRTRHLDKMKAYDHTQLLRARELIPTEGSRAHHDQTGRDHTFVRARALANIILTGITLRQYVQPAVNRQPGYRWDNS